MNNALKHWKEAATLILAAGQRVGADGLLSRTSLTGTGTGGPGSGSGSHLPHWSRFDYDVLLLKRSSKSGFMPNAYVFPGGMLDSSDFSSEWLDVFKSVTNSADFGLRPVRQPPESRPQIFSTDRRQLGSPVPGDAALRICALRETFEESGVLLVLSEEEARQAGEDGFKDEMGRGLCRAHQLCSDELAKWRALVNRDPSNFIRMCKQLQLLPNIWALHEWANWLTPAGRPGARFDTAFFMCCLQEVPDASQDEKEIVRFQWSRPSEILQSYRARQLLIPRPQFYELSRMCCFPSLSDLHSFAYERATEGCEHLLPVISKVERHTALLPGDKHYPLHISRQTEADNRTDFELNDTPNGALHRIVMSDPYTPTLQITITPKYNHLLPLIEPASSQDSKSKL
ncbi:nucleoside diphosphate-linked moiety X motif 19 [Cololabis saira]|uniref:nucleoside diphosphate-linked moiety X motif 19 n=1 Tax=Cololabis saira TaxID=129043 RepID=UPI002AD43615|nr:nucleoside diphosphate-linked moiety X motif 19 [Cololabis saira]